MQKHAFRLTMCLLLGGPFGSPAFAGALLAISTAPTKVGPVQFNPQASELCLRLSGKKPAWQLMRNGARIRYMDITATGQEAAELQEDRSLVLKQAHPLVKEIRLAQRSNGVVRLVVEGVSPFSMAPSLAPEGEGWILAVKLSALKTTSPANLNAPESTSMVSLSPSPLSSPSSMPPLLKTEAATLSVRQPEVAVIDTPVASTPGISAAIDAPFATPAPLAQPVFKQAVNKLELHPELELTYSLADLAEDYEAGNSKTKIAGNDVYTITWHEHWASDWSSALQVRRWGTYTIVDSDLTGSSHNRTETWVQATIAHPLTLLGLPQSLSIGYLVRAVQNDNTFAAPQASYLFSKQQFYQGVVLGDRTVIPLWGPLRAAIGLSAQPLTSAMLDPGVPAVGPLFGFGAELGLEASLGSAVGRVSWRYDEFRLLSGSFQDISAPELSVSYRF